MIMIKSLLTSYTSLKQALGFSRIMPFCTRSTTSEFFILPYGILPHVKTSHISTPIKEKMHPQNLYRHILALTYHRPIYQTLKKTLYSLAPRVGPI